MAERKRTQLNLRFDGKDDLLESLKSAAQAKGESLNAYCVKGLAELVEMSSVYASTVSSAVVARHDASDILDKVAAMLAERLGGIEERLGKIENRDGGEESLKQELLEARQQLEEAEEKQERLEMKVNDVAETTRNLWRGRLTKVESELAAAREQLSAQTVPDSEILELPEAADLLNQLKARRKKSKADLADVEAILEMIGG